MREKLTTFLIVTLVTLTVWLFAEAESLGHESLPASVTVVSADNSRLVTPATGWDGRVTLDVSGSRRGIERARDLFLQPIKVTLPKGVGEGDLTVELYEALETHESIARSGVTIDSVRPLRAVVQVQELVTRQATIVPELIGVQVDGQVAMNPDKADVRLPRGLADRLTAPGGAGLTVTARVPEAQRAALGTPGPKAIQATLVLPEAVVAEAGAAVELLTKGTALAFTVKSTLTTVPISFPVQVLTLPVEWGDWTVEIRAADQSLAAELSGPSDALDKLRSPESRPLAVLALSSDDLARGVTSKEVGFGVVRDGVFGPLPDGVKVNAERRTVSFEVKKRVQP
ncbi:MAG: hypothetical protein ACKVZJ_13355 [Phycisphaerales bacterium]